jgi:hypothetical protein
VATLKGELKGMLDVTEPTGGEMANNAIDKTGAYFKLAMAENFSTENIDVRTHVTDSDIDVFSDSEMISNYFGGIPCVEFKVEKEKRLLISKNRGSRNEMREIAIGIPAAEDPDKKLERQRLDTLLGRR